MKLSRIALAVVVLLASASTLHAAVASWDRNPEPTVTGYRLSYGTQSGVHPTMIDVGNVITYQFTPPPGQRYYVVVQAYDSAGGLSAKSAEVIIDIPVVGNQAPTLQQPANQTNGENASVSLALVASDPEGSPLTYSATGLPQGLAINATTGLISGTLTYTSAGIHTVTATVSDGSLTNSKSFTWTVVNINRAPTLTQPANQTSAENASVSLALVASDPDGTPLTYSATGLPPGLAINSATGLISGTLSYTSAGTHTVTATVSDGSLTASKSFTWTVSNTNRPPALTQPVNQTSVVNASVSLALIGSDPDGTPLTYSATGLPPGLSVNSSSGVISGAGTTAGTYNPTASVSDGSLSSSRTFSWTITTTNRAPVLTQPANQTGVAGSSVSLALVATDPDGTAPTYSATGLPPGLIVSGTTGVISGTLANGSAGAYTVSATASDGSLSDSKTFTWTVTGSNQAPTLTQPADQTHIEGASVSLALVASDPEVAPLTFSASGLPAGLAVNPATGVIAGTISAAGAHTVTATASDGSLSASRTFAWTVTASNGSTVANLSPLDTYIRLNKSNMSSSTSLRTYTFPDYRVSNAILMKFDLSQIPANATITSAVLNLSLTGMDGVTSDPDYGVSLHQLINRTPDIARATGQSADGVQAWTANNCCNNNYPMAQADVSAARAVTNVDRALGFKTWDATSMVQAWRSSPSSNLGLLLNADTTKEAHRYRQFGSTESADVSERPYLRVTYTTSGADTTAPVVSLTTPANNATVSGSSVAVSAAATDAVGVTGVQFRLDGADLGAEDKTSPYTIVWNTTSVANGTHVLTSVARDAAGNITTSTPVTVTVANVLPNRAPTLTQPANQAGAGGNMASLQLVASDPDGNPLTFIATGLPAGLAVNATNGLISGTPTFTSAGAYTVTATVSDGQLSNSKTFSWTVTNTNRAPVLSQPANQTSMESAVVSLALSATDPDGTAVTYGATGLPPGLAVNPATGVIAGAIRSDSVGVYQVTATASDGSLTASKSFVWGVNNSDAGSSGDFDGDGRKDPATYRPATGEWRVWLSGSNFAMATPVVWGNPDDVPVAADYDGDGRTDLAVYRPSTGTWHVLLSGSNGQTNLVLQWGDAADRPVAFDHDGDGKADLGLVRFGGFEILLSSTNYSTSVTVQ